MARYREVPSLQFFAQRVVAEHHSLESLPPAIRDSVQRLQCSTCNALVPLVSEEGRREDSHTCHLRCLQERSRWLEMTPLTLDEYFRAAFSHELATCQHAREMLAVRKIEAQTLDEHFYVVEAIMQAEEVELVDVVADLYSSWLRIKCWSARYCTYKIPLHRTRSFTTALLRVFYERGFKKESEWLVDAMILKDTEYTEELRPYIHVEGFLKACVVNSRIDLLDMFFYPPDIHTRLKICAVCVSHAYNYNKVDERLDRFMDVQSLAKTLIEDPRRFSWKQISWAGAYFDRHCRPCKPTDPCRGPHRFGVWLPDYIAQIKYERDAPSVRHILSVLGFDL